MQRRIVCLSRFSYVSGGEQSFSERDICDATGERGGRAV